MITLTKVDIPTNKKWLTTGKLPLPFIFNTSCICDEERQRINHIWEEGKSYVIVICEVEDNQ